jgi:hypothetical protein
LRKIGCEECEFQIQQLTRSRSLGVREREALWRAIQIECDITDCPMQCSTRGLISRVSSNLASFLERLDRHERQTALGTTQSNVMSTVCKLVATGTSRSEET